VIAPGKFARVLEASGFHRDAIDVAANARDSEFLASTFAGSAGISEADAEAFEYDDLETALLMLAEGHPLDDLKWKISAQLFAILQERYSRLGAEEFQRRFGLAFAEDENLEDESIGTVAFGGSLVNSRRPRFLRRRYAPVSSLNFQ
jgi:hypothetical protein